ncbi:MAG: Tar ligand binding domain-containing protein [Burkholderiaceae bacterium]|nr:Tar ligand binding domain-containing protein [Burkholderiaceae bacterium]
MKLTDLKISTRLSLLLATLCALMLAVGLFGLSGMQCPNTDLRSIY